MYRKPPPALVIFTFAVIVTIIFPLLGLFLLFLACVFHQHRRAVLRRYLILANHERHIKAQRVRILAFKSLP